MCLVCSTLNFLKLYETAPGAGQPATLVSCLPQISSHFQKGQKQCAADFVQEFWIEFVHAANQLKPAFNFFNLQLIFSVFLL